MSARPLRILFMAVVAYFLVFAAGGVLAQNSLEEKLRLSHVLDGLPPLQGSAEWLLQERILGKKPEEIAELLKKAGIKPENFEALLKDDSWRKTLKNLKADDPKLPIPEGLRNMLKGVDPAEMEKKLTPDLLKSFQNTLRRDPESGNAAAAQGTRDGTGPSGMNMAELMKRFQNMKGANPETPGVPPLARLGGGGTGNGEDSGTSERPAAPQASPLVRGLLRAAEKVQQLNPSLQNSPTLQRAIRELSQNPGRPDERWEKLAEGFNSMRSKFGDWGRSLGIRREWTGTGWRWPKALTPDLSRVRVSAPSVPSMGSLPQFTGPSTGSGSAFTWLLLIMGLGLGGFLVWKYWLGGTAEARDEAYDTARLGPWPVSPGAVRTRQDLIKAYEYLSVLRLGRKAITWNHLMIADQLAESDPEAPMRRRLVPASAGTADMPDARYCALELSRYYEQARYTPADEDLPDAALAAARRDLCVLAGVVAV